MRQLARFGLRQLIETSGGMKHVQKDDTKPMERRNEMEGAARSLNQAIFRRPTNGRPSLSPRREWESWIYRCIF
jgi:hypothetical protein